jgi:hypothetical protein
VRALVAIAGALAGCGGDRDPCADVAGRCLALDVRAQGFDRIDQLELDVLYGDLHATATTQADGGRIVALPLVTAIDLDATAPGELAVGIVAAGKLGGTVQGTGAASATLAPGEHAAVELLLVAPDECVGGSFYCGGDKVAGDPDTLYECNEGGVPLARGRCAWGCVVRPADDDTCRGGGGTCVDGGSYCGGDKLDGDPQTLYTCSGGFGVDGVECADGCVVAPEGQDDHCR